MGVVPVTAQITDREEQTADLVVAEVYARAWQGEGPSAGVRCSFVRLGGCNLTCGWKRTTGGLARVPGAWACDEAKTWHSGYDLRATLTRMPAEAAAAIALRHAPPLVVVTGGEPLIHQDQAGFTVLLARLLDGGARVEIETNGTLIPAGPWARDGRVAFNVSPKLASSGLPEAARLVPDALSWHAACPRSSFKFVATSPADVLEAAVAARQWGVPPGRTWIMPEGVTAARVLDVARDIAGAVALAGLNLTLRQHVLIYDKAGEPRDD